MNPAISQNLDLSCEQYCKDSNRMLYIYQGFIIVTNIRFFQFPCRAYGAFGAAVQALRLCGRSGSRPLRWLPSHPDPAFLQCSHHYIPRALRCSRVNLGPWKQDLNVPLKSIWRHMRDEETAMLFWDKTLETIPCIPPTAPPKRCWSTCDSFVESSSLAEVKLAHVCFRNPGTQDITNTAESRLYIRLYVGWR